MKNPNKLIFKRLLRLKAAGTQIHSSNLPTLKEEILNQIQSDYDQAFDFLNSIHRKIFGPSVPIYEAKEDWSVSKKAPMEPLGAGNDAFPAGYFDSFTGKLANGQVEVE